MGFFRQLGTVSCLYLIYPILRYHPPSTHLNQKLTIKPFPLILWYLVFFNLFHQNRVGNITYQLDEEITLSIITYPHKVTLTVSNWTVQSTQRQVGIIFDGQHIRVARSSFLSCKKPCTVTVTIIGISVNIFCFYYASWALLSHLSMYHLPRSILSLIYLLRTETNPIDPVQLYILWRNTR